MSGESAWATARLVVVVGACLMASCANYHRPPSRVESEYAGPLLSADIERGGHIFRTYCNPCHAGRVNPEGYAWSPAQMRKQIREGNRMMPPIAEAFLSPSDVEAVLAFLTVIGAVDADLPAAPEPAPAAEAALTPRPVPEAPLPAPDETPPGDALDDEPQPIEASPAPAPEAGPAGALSDPRTGAESPP